MLSIVLGEELGVGADKGLPGSQELDASQGGREGSQGVFYGGSSGKRQATTCKKPHKI